MAAISRTVKPWTKRVQACQDVSSAENGGLVSKTSKSGTGEGSDAFSTNTNKKMNIGCYVWLSNIATTCETQIYSVTFVISESVHFKTKSWKKVNCAKPSSNIDSNTPATWNKNCAFDVPGYTRQDYDQDDVGRSRYVKICCNHKKIDIHIFIFACRVVLADFWSL